MALIEFYVDDAKTAEARIMDGAVPREDEYVNIRGVTWRVNHVTWALDHAGLSGAALRANVVLVKP